MEVVDRFARYEQDVEKLEASDSNERSIQRQRQALRERLDEDLVVMESQAIVDRENELKAEKEAVRRDIAASSTDRADVAYIEATEDPSLLVDRAEELMAINDKRCRLELPLLAAQARKLAIGSNDESRKAAARTLTSYDTEWRATHPSGASKLRRNAHDTANAEREVRARFDVTRRRLGLRS
jgi:hypothetical protein